MSPAAPAERVGKAMVVEDLARAMAGGVEGLYFDPGSGCICTADQAGSGRIAIPERRHIEQREHLRAFLDDYAPDASYLHDQAYEAYRAARSVEAWRRSLGASHRAVVAFDAWMQGFYQTMARLFLVSQRRMHLGVLGYSHADPG